MLAPASSDTAASAQSLHAMPSEASEIADTTELHDAHDGFSMASSKARIDLSSTDNAEVSEAY
jgi:hypothetical protein